MSEITCRTCGQTKPRADYYSQSASTRIRQPCKECWRARRNAAYANNNGVDVSYEQVLKREYSMTLEQYRDLERRQGNRCAICRRPETSKYKTGRAKRLAVDHDHATNTVRALLCHRCNLLVWALEDNHTTLGAVEAYVLQHRESFANGVPL